MGDGVIVDGVARTGWVEGKMNLYLPFAVAGLIPASSRMQYTSEGFGVVKNGFIGKIAGFNVFEHNGITRDSSGNYIIFAGVEGQTLGLIKQKDMEMEEMRDIATFSSNYRSLGLYGAGLIRPDKLAAAYVSVYYS
jgi:hypothetical protein